MSGNGGPELVVRVSANLSELRSALAEGVTQFETTRSALNQMSNAFDGSRTLAQAGAVVGAILQIGDVTKLTAAEQARANQILEAGLDKYRALGKEAPAGMKALADATKAVPEQSGGFFGWLDELGHSFVARVAEGILLRDAIRELINFGKEALTETAKLEDLSKATGLSTTALQKFSYVGKEFGVDTEQMARGVEQLSAKLATGDTNATKAVQQLGLSVKDLIASGPEHAFLSIAEAVGRVEDPMQKNGLAAELFGGKLGRVLIPMLSDLRTKMEEVPKSAIISEENITKAHDAEVAWERLVMQAKKLTVEVALAVEGYGHFIKEAARLTAEGDFFGRSLDENRKKITTDIELHKDAMSATDLLANRIKALRTEAVEPLTDAQKGSIAQLESFGVSHKEIASLVRTSEIAVKLYTESLKEQEKAVKAAVAELKKWDEQLEHMDRETFKLAMEHQKQWHGEQVARAKIQSDAIASEFEAQTKLNAEWGRNAAGAIQLQESALQTLNKALDALRLKKEEALAQGVVIVSQDKEKQVLLDAYTKSLYAEAVAQDRLAGSLTTTTKGYYAQIDALALLLGMTAVGNRANAPGTGVNHGVNERGPGINQGATVPINGGIPNPFGTFSAPGRADGGPVSGGAPYMVGERGPELFVPQTSGAIVPSGGGGGSSVVNIYVTQPLGTPSEIARVVGDALLARQFAIGNRMPTGVMA